MTQKRDDEDRVSPRRADSAEVALNSPQAQEARDRNPLVNERRALYADAAAGLLRELRLLGYDVAAVNQLRQVRTRYDDAIPILLRRLPRAGYLPLVQDILKTLSVPFAKSQVAPIFLRLFKSPPEAHDPLRPEESGPIRDDLRFTIGTGLAVFSSPELSDGLLELANDRKYGWTRSQIVASLPKTKDERVPEVLLGLLDDPSVAGYAIEALGKLKWVPASDSIAKHLNDTDWHTRTEAKKALKRLKPS